MKTITINENTKAGKALLELASVLAVSNKSIVIATGIKNQVVVKPASVRVESAVKLTTPNQRRLINNLKKVKKAVDNGTHKGQSAKAFLNGL